MTDQAKRCNEGAAPNRISLRQFTQDLGLVDVAPQAQQAPKTENRYANNVAAALMRANGSTHQA